MAACVLAAAALGGTAYGLWPDGGTSAPEKYSALQECDGLAVALPLPPRDRGSDRHSSADGETRTGCTWFGSRDGGAPSARVLWNLRHDDGARDAAAVQSEAFRALVADGRAVGDLGFGDEAFRGASDTTTACSLSVRDGNLTVQVDLGSEEFPAPTCNASTVDIARAALNAVLH